MAKSRDGRYLAADASDDDLKTEKKGLKDRMSSWKLCAMLGPLGVKNLDLKRRRYILSSMLTLLSLGIFLSFLGVWGAYAGRKFGLHMLRWASFTQRTGVESVFAGIRQLCREGNNQPTACDSFDQLNCKAYYQSSDCLNCVDRSSKMFIPVAMALLTYLKLTHDVYNRYKGIDSNCGKVGSLFCTLVGNTNFIFALVSYQTTCVKMLKTDVTAAHVGPGFTCIAVAAVIKTVVGFATLALPVHAFTEEDIERAEDDSEADSESD